MNYLAAGLAIILIIVAYYLYYYFTNPSLTSGLQTLNQPSTTPYTKLVNPNSLTYSYQGWFYISSAPTSQQPIFCRNIASKQNVFEVDLSGQTLTLLAGKGNDSIPKLVMTITTDFPIQKWVYLVVNVYNLTTFEAYINGKLVKTVNVSNSADYKPTSSMNNLVLGNVSVSGYAIQFIRSATPMDAKTVWNTYLSGNGLTNVFSNIMPYGLTMSVANGEDVQRVFKLW